MIQIKSVQLKPKNIWVWPPLYRWAILSGGAFSFSLKACRLNNDQWATEGQFVGQGREKWNLPRPSQAEECELQPRPGQRMVFLAKAEKFSQIKHLCISNLNWNKIRYYYMS